MSADTKGPAAPERMDAVRAPSTTCARGAWSILVDDEDRENEGDLVLAADLVTPEAINFMARHGRGLICLSLTEERVATLGLPLMTSSADNRSPRHTDFTVSIDARRGTTTGISARERAETIRVAVARDAGPDDIVTPGHVFPLRARRGGVLVRSGHTEGSVDLARLAGREPAAVICEIMREDGEMARMPDLEAFAAEHGLADRQDRRPHRVPPVARDARAARRRVGRAPARGRRARRVPRLRLHDRRRGHRVPRARAGRHPPRRARARARADGERAARRLRGRAGDDAQAAGVPLRLIEEAGKGVMLYVFPRGRASVLAEFRAVFGGAAARRRRRAAGRRLAAAQLRPGRAGARAPRRAEASACSRTTRGASSASRGYGLEIVECLPIGAPAKVVRLRKVEGDGDET